MTRTVVLGEPPAPLAEWLQHRRELGQDLFDEVWEGEYHVAPAGQRRHGDVDAQLHALLWARARRAGLWPSGPANIGEQRDYRVPDAAFFRHRRPVTFEPTAAIVVEIVSPGDESYAKFGFYFARGVQELLIIDPERWAVECYARGAEGFERADGSELLALTGPELATEIDWPS